MAKDTPCFAWFVVFLAGLNSIFTLYCSYIKYGCQLLNPTPTTYVQGKAREHGHARKEAITAGNSQGRCRASRTETTARNLGEDWRGSARLMGTTQTELSQ